MIFIWVFQKYVDIFSWKSENAKFWWKSGNPENILDLSRYVIETQVIDSNNQLSNAWIKSENAFHFSFQKYVDIFFMKSENVKFW